MWSAVSSAISGVSNLLGAGVSAYANHREADMNRDFQERMFKNRYQYSVADLKAAGLNPALAYGNLSASVPSGSQAAPTDFSKAFNLAQMKLLQAQEKLAEQQAESNAKQADAKAALDLASAREVNARANTEEMRNAWYLSLSPSERSQLFNTREYGGSTIQQLRSVLGQTIGTIEQGTSKRVGEPPPTAKKPFGEMSALEKHNHQRAQEDWVNKALKRWGFRFGGV